MDNRELKSAEWMVSRLTGKLMDAVGCDEYANPQAYIRHMRLVNLIAEISITTNDFVYSQITGVHSGFKTLIERTSITPAPQDMAESALRNFFEIAFEQPDIHKRQCTHIMWPVVRDYIEMAKGDE